MKRIMILSLTVVLLSVISCGAAGFAEKSMGRDQMVRHYSEFVELRESYLNHLTRYLNLDMMITEMEDEYGDELPRGKQAEYEQMLTDRRGALHMVNDAARRYNQKAHDLTESFSAKVVQKIFTRQDQVLSDSLVYVTAQVDSLWRDGMGAEVILP